VRGSHVMKLIKKYFIEAVIINKKKFLVSLLLILLLTIVSVFIPYGLRVFMEQISNNFSIKSFSVGIILFLALLLIKTALKIYWYIKLDDFGGSFIDHILQKLILTTSRSSMSEIDKVASNNIKHIMYHDVLNIFIAIGHDIPALIGSIVIIIASLVLALFFDIRITLYIFIAIAIGIFVSLKSRKIIAEKATETNKKLKRHSGIIAEYVDSLFLVQTNNITPFIKSKFSTSVGSFIETSKKEDRIVYFWSDLVSNYNILFKIVLSALLIMPFTGSSIVDLVFFTMLANLIMDESQKTELLVQKIMKYKVSFENVDHLLALKNRQGNLKLDSVNEINIQDLKFCYNKNHSVFKNFSHTMKRGDFVHIEGHNGSGKSTLIKLLMGLYSPEQGEILINNIPLREYSQETINEKILYVGQDEVLLNEEISDYLKIISGVEVSNEQMVHMHELLKLGDVGLKISENGQSLSVGQRKKLLIMKLMLKLKSADVVILDELKTGLDKKTKNLYDKIINDIAQAGKKIVIVIDHEATNELKFNKKIVIDTKIY